MSFIIASLIAGLFHFGAPVHVDSSPGSCTVKHYRHHSVLVSCSPGSGYTFGPLGK